MPVMNGMESTRRIREYEVENGIKRATVIALTGLASAAAQAEAEASGIDIYMPKPVKFQELRPLLVKKGEEAKEKAKKEEVKQVEKEDEGEKRRQDSKGDDLAKEEEDSAPKEEKSRDARREVETHAGTDVSTPTSLTIPGAFPR